MHMSTKASATVVYTYVYPYVYSYVYSYVHIEYTHISTHMYM